MRWRLGLAVVALLAAAGCVGSGDGGADEVDGASTEDTEPEEGIDGSSANETRAGGQTEDEGTANATDEEEGEALEANRSSADVYLAAGQADDPAAVRGFAWTVPEGASVEDPDFPELRFVPLEIVVEIDEAGELDRLGVMFFRLGEIAEPRGSHVQLPQTIVERTVEDEQTRERAVERTSFTYSLYGVEARDPLGIALAAASAEPGAVELAFRVAEDREDGGAETVPELVEKAGSDRVHELEATGEGEGLHAARYYESKRLDREEQRSYTRWSEDVEMSTDRPADARPASTSGSIELSSTFETDEGYSQTVLVRFGTSSAGHWSGQASVHGLQEGAGGPFVLVNGLGLPGAVPGTYGFSLAAEAGGEGGSELHAAVDQVGADRSSFLSFSHVALGASLETLFGTPAEERVSVFGMEDQVPAPDAEVPWTISPAGELGGHGWASAACAACLPAGSPPPVHSG